MTDWTGSGTVIAGTTSTACFEYITVAEVRAEFGAEITDDTDVSIQRRIDQLVSELEDNLGHTFGRALIAYSSGSDAVAVTATELTIGGDSYLFTTYDTLQELVAAVNAAGASYGIELLPQIAPDTPSTLLKTYAGGTCGPAYDNRIVLCISAMYVRLTGKPETHLFLPLALAQVNSIVEDLVALTSSYYWAVPGDSWIIRKACGCTTSCVHAKAYWSSAYPGNIALTFVPSIWGARPPASLKRDLLSAYEAQSGLAPFESENFGDYSYRRGTAPVTDARAILGGASARRYAVKFHP